MNDLNKLNLGMYLPDQRSANLPVVAQTPAPGTPISSSTTGITLTPGRSSQTYQPQVSPSSPGGPLSSGTYMVGSDIAPGTWHTDGGSRCYYERSRNTEGTISSIIKNDNFTGPTTITVKASDASVKFSGDCVWTRR